jgi:hypothetical protein
MPALAFLSLLHRPFDNLGVQSGLESLLGRLAAAMMPILFIFYRWGHRDPRQEQICSSHLASEPGRAGRWREAGVVGGVSTENVVSGHYLFVKSRLNTLPAKVLCSWPFLPSRALAPAHENGLTSLNGAADGAIGYKDHIHSEPTISFLHRPVLFPPHHHHYQ